jgi:hypothetical protein
MREVTNAPPNANVTVNVPVSEEVIVHVPKGEELTVHLPYGGMTDNDDDDTGGKTWGALILLVLFLTFFGLLLFDEYRLRRYLVGLERENAVLEKMLDKYEIPQNKEVSK